MINSNIKIKLLYKDSSITQVTVDTASERSYTNTVVNSQYNKAKLQAQTASVAAKLLAGKFMCHRLKECLKFYQKQKNV